MTHPGFPPHGYPQFQPPQRSLWRRFLPLWITLIVLFVGLAACGIAFGVAVGNNVQETNDANGNHPEDVRIDACTADSIGALRATVTVTNSAERSVTYAVQVAFTAPDGPQVATGWAYITRLAPDQAARETALGASVQAAGMQVGCRVLSAQRTALP